jgi:hypothetical protein
MSGTSMMDRLVRVMAPLVTGQAFDRLAKTHQAPLVAAVRAMLAELRNPTDAMLTAGDDPAFGLGPEYVDAIWRAMLDAALAEAPR